MVERVVPLVLTVVLAVGLSVAARRRPGSWLVFTARTMAFILVANLVILQIATVHGGHWDPAADAMVDVCPVTAVIAAIALWSPPLPLLVELTYFWGCAGTIQGVVTPDTRWDFPSYFYFQFYVTHVGVVLAGVFLVAGLRIVPRRHAILRVYAISVGFAVVAWIADVITGGNYLFLRNKATAGTLLDVMGPWPWYIGSAALLALVFFLALDTPFRIARRRARHQVPLGEQEPTLDLRLHSAGG